MSKLLLILLPLALYGLWVGIAAARNRRISRRMVNLQTSLFLMVYLLITSGLGIFWVANQQLPVFDWHYVFGYGTLLLVAVHLSFNLPPLVRTLSRKSKRSGPPISTPRMVTALFILSAMSLSFYVGMRYSSDDILMPWTAETHPEAGPIDAVVRYHEFSSHSDADIFATAPAVVWGPEVEPFKHYDGPIIELPEFTSSGRPLHEAVGAPALSREALSLSQLSSILFHTAGITTEDGDLTDRAAPSSGALMPTEVYLQAVGVRALPDALYHYSPEHHQLVRVGEPSSDVQETRIYLSSVFRRTGQKYEDRAYRYAIADGGHMLENLRISAAEFGHGATPLTHFDESEIETMLGIDGVDEGIVAAIPLSGEAHPMHSTSWRFAEPPTETRIGVTGVVHRATSLRQQREEGTPFPAISTATDSVFEVIERRRSRRKFSEEPVPIEALSAMLVASTGPGPLLSRSLQIRFVVNRVEGLEPGLYRYLPESHAWILERTGDLSDAAYQAAFSQDVIGDASVVFVMSAERKNLFSDHGARGYRHAFLEVGMSSQRVLLTAESLGISACPVGAFFDDEANALIGMSPDQEWPLHFIGLGMP